MTASLIALRRELHMYPELAFAEHRTAEIVATRLQAAGLEVRTGIAGTGVVAILRGGRPGRTIGWRADMDALPITELAKTEFASRTPGVMHACGHDGHVAIAVTLAERLALQRETLAGTVVFLFQPAEEIFAGASAMLAGGVLDDPHVDALYGLHLTTAMPCGHVGVREGPMWASADAFSITIRGIGGHGAFPHLAVDPVTAAAHVVVGMPTLVAMEVPASEPVTLTVGEFHAGTAYNVIPSEALLSGSLRTLSDAAREQLKQRLPELAERIANAHRASAEVKWLANTCPTLVNDARAARIVHDCASQAGAPVLSVAPSLASDDMSLFLRQRPGCFFKLGCAINDGQVRPHHNAFFDIDERALIVGVDVASRVLVSATGEDVPAKTS